MNKKVCILTSVHPVFDSRIFHKQAKSLVKAGYDVILIAQNDKDEVVDGVKIIAIKGTKNRVQRLFKVSHSILRLALNEKADVYHFHDPELLIVGALLKILTGKKIIYDVHENYYVSIKNKKWIPKIFRNIMAHMFVIVEHILTKFVDKVITVTDTIDNRYKKCDTIQIRNYPVISTNNLEYKKSNENKTFTIIYVGALTEVRGIREVVKSMKYLNNENVNLKLLGNFNSTEFENEVKSLKEYERVEFCGWVNHEEVLKSLVEADIGLVILHPTVNFKESLPIKLFEYMAAGIPVIASNFELWKSIIENENCGLVVDPCSPTEIAEAVDYLLDNLEVRRNMGHNGKRAALNTYNWIHEEKKMIDMYKKLLQN